MDRSEFYKLKSLRKDSSRQERAKNSEKLRTNRRLAIHAAGRGIDLVPQNVNILTKKEVWLNKFKAWKDKEKHLEQEKVNRKKPFVSAVFPNSYFCKTKDNICKPKGRTNRSGVRQPKSSFSGNLHSENSKKNEVINLVIEDCNKNLEKCTPMQKQTNVFSVLPDYITSTKRKDEKSSDLGGLMGLSLSPIIFQKDFRASQKSEKPETAFKINNNSIRFYMNEQSEPGSSGINNVPRIFDNADHNSSTKLITNLEEIPVVLRSPITMHPYKENTRKELKNFTNKVNFPVDPVVPEKITKVVKWRKLKIPLNSNAALLEFLKSVHSTCMAKNSKDSSKFD